MKLLVATHNTGKKREFVQLFADLDLEIITLHDLGISQVIPETGASYAANALAKAQGYADIAAMLTLADDSGLEVDALHGEPGVHSARFGGNISDTARCEMLLLLMQNVPQAQRTARFRCVIALAWPHGRSEWVEGVCEGSIISEMRGKGGFGYDPIFYVEDAGMTMAELSGDDKNRISHRARAAVNARVLLVDIIKQAIP
jgi:XTP/dITP diphosphohydrolase